jgi:dTDP-4-amino-4,6-dideoxygalactose transaminase
MSCGEGDTGEFEFMSAQGPHIITELFEKELCRYTGAPYAVAVDNASNGLFLCLVRERNCSLPRHNVPVTIPKHTYPSVPCEIKLAGYDLRFSESEPMLTGEYRLIPTRIWDSALRFTADMYRPGQLQCVSFTGPYKHLKLGKGGAILCDREDDYEWFKRARNSGRGECSYHEDNFTMIGRNCYMHPSVAALGLQLMPQLWNLDGTKKVMPDICLPYPDLSLHPAYK